ncbi:MAG TPA: YraN family protein [Propionibacteriaceae bacterium]|nr:YraN family protein [Propionibacteriaceae bacterium]
MAHKGAGQADKDWVGAAAPPGAEQIGRRRPKGRQQVGVEGETLAVAALREQGMQILAQNWRCTIGEIDIVALDVVSGRRTLVFCEVKCRTGLGFGSPLEAITHAKVRKLRQLSAHWLHTESVQADAIRLDAIGVLLLSGRQPTLTHVRGIG